MKRGVVVGIGLVSLIAALLVMNFFSPKTIGPFGVLAFFVLLYVACVAFLYVVLATVVLTLCKLNEANKWRLRAEQLTKVKLYYYASFIGLAPVIVLGMQTVGDIRLTEIFLLVLFQLIGCFYLYKRF